MSEKFLLDVDIMKALSEICRSMYGEFSKASRIQLADDIRQQFSDGKCFIFLVLQDEVKVVSEYQLYVDTSPVRRYMKQLLPKTPPVILAVSIFEDNKSLHGDISAIIYNRLLDKMGGTKISMIGERRMTQFVARRRELIRSSSLYEPVSMPDFIEYLRSINPNWTA